MSVLEIGCCGAYCGTCKSLKQKLCKGCKIGYADGSRDIAKAKCKIKVCCLSKQYNACADCPELDTCVVLNQFYGNKSYKYKKYKEAITYIRDHGYEAFLKIADGWTNACGKYEEHSKPED